jgi:hypothetical protein
MKLGPILAPKPVRLNARIPTDLKSRLDRYAALHCAAFNESVDISTLVPHMLKAFLDADPAFRKAEKESAG